MDWLNFAIVIKKGYITKSPFMRDTMNERTRTVPINWLIVI